MKERIIVRTISNLSYAGSVVSQKNFEGSGVALSPNHTLDMEIFIPENEIIEVVSKGQVMPFQTFMQMQSEQ